MLAHSTALLRTALVAIGIMLLFTAAAEPLPLECNADAAQRNLASMYLSHVAKFNIREQHQTVGDLKKGSDTYITLNLFKGNEYLMLAAGDDCVKKIEVYVYDEMGLLVGKMTGDKGRAADLTFKATYSGTYFVKVLMREASTEKAFWAFTYGYR